MLQFLYKHIINVQKKKQNIVESLVNLCKNIENNDN